MSDSYDEKVVELRFDNSDFEKNATQSMETMSSLKKTMTDEDVDMSAITKALDKCSDGFSAMEVVAITAISNITNKVVNMGEQLLSSVTVDQLAAGWEKYESKTTSVQAIMNATGKSIDVVNEKLDTLMWFSDETSYSFADMTDAIGKFTATNVDLDTATNAVQGISTWAALSGANKTQASRAMYNIAQALGVGYVQKIDWKSIENAQMATYEFKEMVLDTAANLGDASTLIENADGTYTSILNDDIVTAENFANELTETQFLSNDVLLATLDTYGKFSTGLKDYMDEVGLDTASEAIEPYVDYLKEIGEWDDSWELAEKAFKAAQEAKTWSEVVESVKDAVSTKWMNIWEMLFGNYEEAKGFWTDMANGAWTVFAGPLDDLNTKFEEWYEGSLFHESDDTDYWYGTAAKAIGEAVDDSGEAITGALWKYDEFGNVVRSDGEAVTATSEQLTELADAMGIDTFQEYSDRWDEWRSAVASLNQELNTVSGHDMFIQALYNLGDAFMSLREGIGDTFTYIFGEFTSSDLLNITSGFLDFTYKVKDAFAYVSNWWGDMTDGAEEVMEAVEPVTEAVSGMTATMEKLDELTTQTINGLWGNGDERRAALEDAGYVYELVQNSVNERLGASFRYDVDTTNVEASSEIISSATDLVTAASDEITDASGEMADASGEIADSEAEAAEEGETLADIIHEIATSYKEADDEASEYEQSSAFMDDFVHILAGALTILQGIGAAIKSIVKNVGVPVLKIALTIFMAVFHVLANIGDVITSIGNSIKDAGGLEIFNDLMSGLKTGLEGINTALQNLFQSTSVSNLGSSIGGFFTMFAGSLKTGWAALKEQWIAMTDTPEVQAFLTNLEEIKTTVKESFTGFLDTISGWLTRITGNGIDLTNWSWLTGAVQKVLGYVNQIIDKLQEGNVIGSFWTFLKGFFTGGSDESKTEDGVNNFTKLWNTVKSFFSNIGTTLGEFFTTFAGYISDGWSKLTSIDWGQVLASIVKIGLAIVSIYNLYRLVHETGSIAEGISGILESVKKIGKAYAFSVLADGIKAVAISVAILSASLIALTLVDTGKLATVAGVLVVVFLALAVALKIATSQSVIMNGVGDALKEGFKSLGDALKTGAGAFLKKIGTAALLIAAVALVVTLVASLAGLCLVINKCGSTVITAAIILGAIFVAIAAFAIILEKEASHMTELMVGSEGAQVALALAAMGTIMLAMAAAIAVIVVAIAALSGIMIAEQSVAPILWSLGVIIALIAAFTTSICFLEKWSEKLVNVKATKILAMAVIMGVLLQALTLLVAEIVALSAIMVGEGTIGYVAAALGTIVLSLAAITVSVCFLMAYAEKLYSVDTSKILAMAVVIAAIGVVCALIGQSVSAMAEMAAADLGGFIAAATSMVVFLGIMLAAIIVLNKISSAATAGSSVTAIFKLVAVAAVLVALGVAMEKFANSISTMSGVTNKIGNIVAVVLGFAAALGVLVAAAAILKALNASGGMFSVLIGLSALLLASAAAITAFAYSIDMLAGHVEQIPEIMAAVAQGIADSFTILAKNKWKIYSGILVILGLVVSAILLFKTKIANSIVSVITSIATTISKGKTMAIIFGAIGVLLAGLVEWLGGNLEAIANQIVGLIVLLVADVAQGIISYAPELANTLWLALCAIFVALADMVLAPFKLLGGTWAESLTDGWEEWVSTNLDSTIDSINEKLGDSSSELFSSNTGGWFSNLFGGAEDDAEEASEGIDSATETLGFSVDRFGSEYTNSVNNASKEVTETTETASEDTMTTIADALDNLEETGTLTEGTGDTIISALELFGIDTSDEIESSLGTVADTLVSQGIITEDQATTVLEAISSALAGSGDSSDYELGDGAVEEGISDSGEGMGDAVDGVTTNVTTAVDAYNQQVQTKLEELGATNDDLEVELENGEKHLIQAQELGSSLAAWSFQNTDQNQGAIESYFKYGVSESGLDIDWNSSEVQSWFKGLETQMDSYDSLYQFIQEYDWNNAINTLNGTEGVNYSEAIGIFSDKLYDYIAGQASSGLDSANVEVSDVPQTATEKVDAALQEYSEALASSHNGLFGFDSWESPGKLNTDALTGGQYGDLYDAIDTYNGFVDQLTEDNLTGADFSTYQQHLAEAQTYLQDAVDAAMEEYGNATPEEQDYWSGVVSDLQAKQAEVQSAIDWADSHAEYVLGFNDSYAALAQAYEDGNPDYVRMLDAIKQREQYGIEDSDLSEITTESDSIGMWIDNQVSTGMLNTGRAEEYSAAVDAFVAAINDPTTYMSEAFAEFVTEWESMDTDSLDAMLEGGDNSFLERLTQFMFGNEETGAGAYDSDAAYQWAYGAAQTYSTQVDAGFEAGMSGSGSSSATASEYGQDYVDGYEEPFYENDSSLQEAGANLPTQAGEGLTTAQDSASPSQVAKGYGTDFGDGYILGLNEGQDDAYSAGSDLGQQAIDGLNDTISEQTPVTITYETQQVTTADVDTSSYSSAGKSAASSEASGISSGSGAISKASQKATSNAANAAKGSTSSFYSVGYYLASGVARGISAGSSLAYSAAVTMAKQVLSKMKAAMDINSPSKITYQYGEYLVEGLAEGMDQNSYIASQSAESMAHTALDGAMDYLQNVSSGEYQVATGITPVIDTKVATATAKELNSMFNGSHISVDTNLTDTMSSMKRYATMVSEAATPDNGGVIDTINGLKEDIQGLQTAISGMGFYINGKTLVGSIVKDMDNALGARTIARAR